MMNHVTYHWGPTDRFLGTAEVDLSGLMLHFDVAYGLGILVSILALALIILRT